MDFKHSDAIFIIETTLTLLLINIEELSPNQADHRFDCLARGARRYHKVWGGAKRNPRLPSHIENRAREACDSAIRSSDDDE